jgi:hypothetical protein
MLDLHTETGFALRHIAQCMVLGTWNNQLSWRTGLAVVLHWREMGTATRPKMTLSLHL